MLQAIETRYDGHRFRSRLEARWATVFTSLGVPYEYEKEGYKLPSGYYLPDFWLPNERIWFEVKGEEATDEECRKCFHLADQTGYAVVLANGQIGWTIDDEECGLWSATHALRAFFGFHRPDSKIFPVLSYVFEWNFDPDPEISDDEGLRGFLSQHFDDSELPPPECTRENILRLVELDRRYYCERYGKEHPHWRYGIASEPEDLMLRFTSEAGLQFDSGSIYHPLEITVFNAFQAAREARFEHGETPLNGSGRVQP